MYYRLDTFDVSIPNIGIPRILTMHMESIDGWRVDMVCLATKHYQYSAVYVNSESESTS